MCCISVMTGMPSAQFLNNLVIGKYTLFGKQLNFITTYGYKKPRSTNLKPSKFSRKRNNLIHTEKKIK